MKLFLLATLFLLSSTAEASEKEKVFYASCVSTANQVLTDFGSVQGNDKEVNSFRCRNIANNINKNDGWNKLKDAKRSGCMAAIAGALEDLVQANLRFSLFKKYC